MLSYSSWPCTMCSYDLDLRDSKAGFLRYPRADLCWHILLIAQDFLEGNFGVCLTHRLCPSFLSNTVAVHEGADWHIQVKTVPNILWILDDFWNTKYVDLRANIPCGPLYPGVICKPKVDTSSLRADDAGTCFKNFSLLSLELVIILDEI